MIILFIALWITTAYSETAVWYWTSIFLASVLSYLAVRAASRSNEKIAQQVKVEILRDKGFGSTVIEYPFIINAVYCLPIVYILTGVVLINTLPIIAALMLTSSLFAIWFCRKLKYQLKLQLGVK